MADGMAVPPNCPQVTRSTFDIHSHGMIWLMQYSLLIDFCISQVLFSIYGIWKVTIFDWIARKRNLKKYGEAGAPDGKPSIVSDWNKQLVCCWSQDAMYGGFAWLHPVAWCPTLPSQPTQDPPPSLLPFQIPPIGHHLNTMSSTQCLIWRLLPYLPYLPGVALYTTQF